MHTGDRQDDGGRVQRTAGAVMSQAEQVRLAGAFYDTSEGCRKWLVRWGHGSAQSQAIHTGDRTPLDCR